MTEVNHVALLDEVRQRSTRSQESIDEYMEMLDFDERVLGIEIWNDTLWFGVEDAPPHERYYRHWDALLKTGRRVYGFFVKDHNWRGRGRNVLLVPPLDGLPREEREHLLLNAYREGRFFGLLGASAVSASGEVVPPYDYSAFRFTNISLEDSAGSPALLRVEVDGHDAAERPEVIVRFVTENGVTQATRGSQVTFRFADGSGALHRFVRVEAFALPRTHLQGRPLDIDSVARMPVYEIARLHDNVGHVDSNAVDRRGEEPVPIADMIFSQPIRILPGGDQAAIIRVGGD